MPISMRGLAALLVLPALAAAAHAQGAAGYPTRPLHWVVPYTPGGATDSVARVVGQKLAAELGQPVIVENKPGGASNIGTEAVARAAPDGYTFLLSTPPISVNGLLYPNLGFDPAKDLKAVAMIARNPNVLVVPAASPLRSVADLIAAARRELGRLSIGSPGIGTVPHLASLLLAANLNLAVTPVPYKGSAAVLQDLIGGQLSAAMDNLYAQMPHLRSGKVRALAVLSPKRSALLPEVPGMAELGIPALADFDGTGWIGVVAPAALPEDGRQKLGKAAAMPDVIAKLGVYGLEIDAQAPDVYARTLQGEAVKWQGLIRRAGVKLD
ncbi:MAG: tripartite tricarboxylate transporter substrate binding protein [Candidatus Protistobacter heckmanni]|nr:tripartite tricarboxylate transporter substrate binding protein [Candidatus Protistobacter heckmanni]